MTEFIAALAGGCIALLGVWLQFKREDKEKMQDYENDLVSMIDLIVYKAARIRNIRLNQNTAFLNKERTTEIFEEIQDAFNSLDSQIQDFILTTSHHSNRSNETIQDFLKRYEPFEGHFNTFKIAFNIYEDCYGDEKHDTANIVRSKITLDKKVYEFINKLENFAVSRYNHKIFEPNLKEVEVVKMNSRTTYKNDWK
ncbi:MULTISPECIES: type I secretion system protein [Staphylococcus]|uniref:type I secretion system protein n=1 Tax=Staphylococcus TaxID=1279 RepID=UPI0019518B62|nr:MULTISPECIES: type I secretion system protein [Staphylococcus]MCD8816232.1 type I secretion system protein [Staphylococcus arlettae]MCD8838708.1 type I secretion system protein [Staphylococcus arlettae]MCD8841292.1 type I secretion system protein [Staphylococcus arlettae]MCD8866222.1 type I secretion system protein [Staphylococcus arlettae]MCD8907540.1 type I secretion system protein [Staphylococcus arlettae]